MQRLVIIFSALVFGGGCSLLLNASDLAGSADDGREAADTADEAAESSVSDAGEGTDAIAEGVGNDAGDAAADTGFCAQNGAAHDFCADFDAPGATVMDAWHGSWTGTKIVAGTVALDMLDPLSAPAALVTTLPSNHTGTTHSASLHRKFDPVPTEVACSFDFRYDYGEGELGFVDVFVDKVAFEVSILPTGVVRVSNTPAATVTPGQWSRLEFVFVRSPPTFRLSLDGVLVHDASITKALPTYPKEVFFVLGFDAESSDKDGASIHYDNVLCDVK